MYQETELLNTLEEIIFEAASIIHSSLSNTRSSSSWVNSDAFKKDEGILADKLSHQYIVSELTHRFPRCIIISEETADHPLHSSNTKKKLLRSDSLGFIIDPLDGTGNASGKRPMLVDTYGISIASFQNGAITSGVVYFPQKNMLFRSDCKYACNTTDAVISGGLYADIMSDSERLRIDQRAYFLKNYLSEISAKSSSKYCASYELLQTLNANDSAIIHYSPSLLYIWDIAAASYIAEKNSLLTVNLETGKKLSCVTDFLMRDDSLRSPIGAITGSISQMEDFIKKYALIR